MSKTAVVIGASGLVGKELSLQLAEDPEYSSVTVLIRKQMDITHPHIRQVLVDFDNLAQYRAEFAAEDIYCCLGTTIAKAGTREAFRRVDLEYPLQAAQLAAAEGAKQFAVITAMGANESSPFFYNRVKGELERRLAECGLHALHIVRPSLLLGHRQEKRTGEEWAAAVSRRLPFLWRGPLKRYRPIQAASVAAAMRAVVRQGKTGVHRYESAELHRLAGD